MNLRPSEPSSCGYSYLYEHRFSVLNELAMSLRPLNHHLPNYLRALQVSKSSTLAFTSFTFSC